MGNLTDNRRQVIPDNLHVSHRAASEKVLALRFAAEDVLVEFGIVHRIEFRDTRCNVTLKNQTDKKRVVNLKVLVLNNALMELWCQTEKWTLTSLQPDQMHAISWEFKPAIADAVWNLKARSEDPAWVVLYVE